MSDATRFEQVVTAATVTGIAVATTTLTGITDPFIAAGIGTVGTAAMNAGYWWLRGYRLRDVYAGGSV